MTFGSDPFAFCPTLGEIVRTRTTAGRSGPRTGLASLSSVNALILLRNLVVAERPARTLEVGLAYGGSALVFTSAHRDSDRPADRQHIAIDPFQTEIWDDAGELAVERAGLSAYLDIRRTPSAFALAHLAEHAEGSVNLAYIDGSHLFEDVFVDWYFVARLLAPNGVVVFDDSSDAHVQKVLRFVRANFARSFTPIDLLSYRGGRGIMHTAAYRAATWLGRTQTTALRKIGPHTRTWNSSFGAF